jgi:hypothetical protein
LNGYFYSTNILARKIIKILTRSLLTLLLLLIAVWFLVQLTPVQNWLVRQAAGKLSKELNTEVSVKHVDFSLFNKMLLEGVLVKDHNKDTLAFIGRAGVNITDWFFLKDKIELKYVSLEQTTIFLHRTDSVWNYQFLVDYFSSPAPKDTTPKKGIELAIKKVDLKQIHLIQKDEWRGQTMEGRIGSLALDINEFNLAKKRIDVNAMDIVSPFFSISNYDGKRPRKTSRKEDDYHQEDVVEHWNKEGWKMTAGNVRIENGEFRNEIVTERLPYNYFDAAHLQFKHINGSFTGFRFAGDTMQAVIKVSAIERSGFEVKQLHADMLWHPTGMEFKHLDAKTGKSRLKDYFAMRYTQFNHDMEQFITHVIMDGNFEDSEIHSDDIAFFAPQLKDWKDRITVSGKVKGTVNHIKGNKVVITTLKQTIFDGNFTIDGLPDINTTFLDLRANRLETSYADAATIYPGIRKITDVALSKINYLKFKGAYTGYFKDFVTYGTIQTNLGTLVTDINLKLPDGGEPIYSGKLKTEGFALGTFMKDPLFGKIVMDATLKGKGFNAKTLFAEVDGKIKSFDINGYVYQNIDAKGIYEKRNFDGSLVVNDPNLKVNLTGLVNLNKDTPVYKVTGDIYEINFKPLGLSGKNLSLKAYVDLDFKGKTIDDFLGTANIENALLTRDGEPLSFDYLSLSSVYTNGKKELIAHSNEADATIRGDFNILDLPSTALSFLHNYFPAYISVPKKEIKKQDFTFDIVTKKIAPFISLWSLPVEGFDYSTIKGRISTIENKFDLQTNVPLFEYKDKFTTIVFNNVLITGTGDYDQLNLQGTLDEIQFNDSLSLPQTTFQVTAANDTGFVSIKTRASQTLKDANLNAHISTTREGVGIVFQPSTLVLNDKIWTIEDNSDVFFGQKQIHSDGMKLTSGTEEILAYTQPSATGNADDFIIELTKVRIDEIIPYFLKDPRLEGVISGRVDIMNPLGKMQVDAELTAEKFMFNNDSIGIVKLNGNYNSETGDINTEIVSDNPLNDFLSKGKINIKDPKKPMIDQVAEIKNVQLSLLQKYLSIITTDMKGTANGEIRIKGNANKPDLIGAVKLSNASFVLDYTKCRYSMKEGTEINFREGLIDFGHITLTDTTKRTATFSGKLYHQFFKDMSFDMDFKANDTHRGLLVLNTTKKDNSLFYGHVIANASGSITGDANDIKLKLRGVPTDSSRVYLPTSDSRVTGTADFIVFRKYGKEMKVESQVKESSSMLVDLDINANPLVKIDLILDEVTNDVIQGQGNGYLNIRVGTFEKTSMTGRFDITNGKYTFNWQRLINKPFDIDRGSVEWNGDPYDAKINIDAKYVVKNITLPEAIARDCNERNDIYVIGNLSNTLKNPLINFRFELPQGHPCRNNPLTISGFQQLYNNPNELNNQVFSLLFFNQFLSNNPNTSTVSSNLGNNVITTAAGTISEFIAKQVSSGLGLALKNIPGLNKLELDPYVTFTPGLISGTQAQAAGFYGTGSFGITRRLLNGRLLLKAGGSVLVNTGQTTTIQNSNQLTPDITLEWLITPDGKLRLIAFHRSIYDVQWRTANRTGISFSYVRDFE